MSNDERKKILDKIQKCLRLAKSSEAHEAAAALRQAQKLMEKFAVSDGELLGVEVESTLVITPEPPKKQFPLYLCALANLCCQAFECVSVFEAVWHEKPGAMGSARQAVRYFGAKGRCEIAAYTHHVIWRQLTSSWNEYRREVYGYDKVPPGVRSSFWIGWLERVTRTVNQFAGKEERARPKPSKEELDGKQLVTLEEADKLNKAIAHHYGEELSKSKVRDQRINQSSVAAGQEAAADFSIHRPMNGQDQLKLSHN